MSRNNNHNLDNHKPHPTDGNYYPLPLDGNTLPPQLDGNRKCPLENNKNDKISINPLKNKNPLNK